ncbi:hypothetical protein HYQ46_006667 [Verticillium longisporum]|nr:hypothetical protein HYQ46_006667 [Verticillium longisporum]
MGKYALWTGKTDHPLPAKNGSVTGTCSSRGRSYGRVSALILATNNHNHHIDVKALTPPRYTQARLPSSEI